MTKVVVSLLLVVCLIAITACSAGAQAQTAAVPQPAASFTFTAAIQPTAPAASTRAPVAPSPGRSLVTDPKILADRLFQATSPESRANALLDVMRALNIGVRKPDTGAAIVAGAERTPNDFYLYDYEIKAIANALERQQMRSVEEIAQFLTGVGGAAGPSAQPIAPETVRKTLLEATQTASANASDPFSRTLLLVRELGLRHSLSFDLLKDVPGQPLQFDALQTLLITTDFAWPAIQSASLVPGNRVALNTNGFRSNPVSSFDSPCSGFAGNLGSGTALWGKYVGGIALGAKWATAAAALPIVTDMIHGEMLAYSVQVQMQEGNTKQFTHYGHETSGKELKFHLKVEMVDDYGDTLVDCGALAGYQIPKPGGIPGVPVVWETHGIEKHGNVSYDPADQKTGPDGIATLILSPKSEFFLRMGMPKSEVGTMTGTALYQSAFGNLPGSIAQFLFPKNAVTGWEVERHAPRGFKFSNLRLHAQGKSAAGTESWDIEVSGNVCGEDPFAKPWNWQEHITNQGVFSNQVDVSSTWQFTSDGKAINAGISSGGDMGGKVQLVPGGPPMIRLRSSFTDLPGVTYSPHDQTNQAVLEEDTTCPPVE